MQPVIAVNRLSEVDAQPVHMHFFNEKSGTADELLAHDLFPESRAVAGGAVVQITTMSWSGTLLGRQREIVRCAFVVWIVTRMALIPVIDILLGSGRVVFPLGTLRFIVIVIVDHVLNDCDASAMALPYEMAIFVATAGTRFDAEMVAIAIPPAGVS